MNRYLFIILTIFFVGFNGNAQTKAQKKTLKKFSKTYKVGKVQEGVFSIQSKKDKLYGLATIDGEILIEPKFKWISNQNKAGHYITAMQRRTSGNDGGGSFLLGLRDLAIYNKLGKQVNVGNLDGIELQHRGGGTYEDDYLRTFKNSSGKMGLLNGSGEVLIEPKYDFIGSPSEKGLGYLFDNNAYGIYDLKNNSFGPLSYTPPISSHDIKNGIGFKGANQPALEWVIQNGYAITSKDGNNFGLLNYNTGDMVFSEEYGYDFEQKLYNYTDEEGIKKNYIIKAKNNNKVALYDGLTKTIFFNENMGFDDVFFFKPTDEKVWVHVRKGHKKNLFNLNTKTLLLTEYVKRLVSLDDDIIVIFETDKAKLFSLAKNVYLSDTTYDDVSVIKQNVLRGASQYVKINPYFDAKRDGKHALLDNNGNQITEFIYENIEQGIRNNDKTKIINDYYLLEIVKQQKSRNAKGQLSSWVETKQAVFSIKENKMIIEDAKRIIYDGTQFINIEKGEKDPLTNIKPTYYTSYDLSGNRTSDVRGHQN